MVPFPGREEEWGVVNQYRVRLAQEARQWSEADRLQQTVVRWGREQAVAALALPMETLVAAPRNTIRTLRVSLTTLGHIQCERGQSDCIATFTEAAEMAKRMGDRDGEAAVAFNLGHTYKNLPAVRNLAEAEQWYRRSLELCGEERRHDR